MTMPSPIHSHPMSEVSITSYFFSLSRPSSSQPMMSIDADLPPPQQLDIELAALLESLSLQQRIRVGPSSVNPPYLGGALAQPNSDLCVEADHDKRASTHRTHRARHANERRRELLPSKLPVS
jgi:hypothetical protein